MRMSNQTDMADFDYAYIAKIKDHARAGMELLAEGEGLLQASDLDLADISECFTIAAKNFDRARMMATELGNHTHPMLQYLWRKSGKKKPTDLSIAATVTYTVDAMDDGIIHIVSNYRCPNFRAADTDFNRYAKDIKENFKSQVPVAKQIRRCYMVFLHHYINRSLYARDVDNYFEKPLSDAIAETLITGGDGPLNVRRVSMAIPDERNYTEVYLVPFQRFPSWLQDLHLQINDC